MIILALPSRNESKSIARITTSADQALASHVGHTEMLLLNIDCSDDDTADIFLSIPTKAKKVSLKVGPGKGTAMREAIAYCVKYNGDVLIFSDTDLKAVQQDWITAFLEKTDCGYDAVFPWRPPIWNAQDLTNQICYPLMRAVYGATIHEPIGGEFALSHKACVLLQNEVWPLYALTYGVDFYLTAQIARHIKWTEVHVSSGKGNTLRSYQPGDQNQIIFGKKFYQVFLSTIACCAQQLQSPALITTPVTKLPEHSWSLSDIPDNDDEMNEVSHSCVKNFSESITKLESAFSAQLLGQLKAISTQPDQFIGVNWSIWEQMLVESICNKKGEFSHTQLEGIEQIFLARTYHHYLLHKGSNKWLETIEKQVASLTARITQERTS